MTSRESHFDKIWDFKSHNLLRHKFLGPSEKGSFMKWTSFNRPQEINFGGPLGDKRSSGGAREQNYEK